jgi:predicted nucleic acid-binding protein
MIAVDTSFLIDYLDGVGATREFLEDRRNTPFFAPSLVLFEVYRGGGRTEGQAGIERVASALEWVDPLPLTDATAREAALVESELLDAGHPVNLGNVLIAGTCRHHGAGIVTRDEHFDRVDGLDVITY